MLFDERKKISFREAIMKSKRIQRALLALSIGLFSAGSAQAAVISLVSGNGAVGGTDSQVSMLVGSAVGAFGASFTATDFTNAATGPAAFIVAPHAAWAPGLAGYAAAQWVSTNALGSSTLAVNPLGASTALYAISFTLGAVSSAVLDFKLNADDFVGSSIAGPWVNQGVFLNGVAIPGSTSGNAATTVFSMTGVDVLSSLVVGQNTLYFNVTNKNPANTKNGPSGLLFGATLTTTSAAIPTPNTISLVALGLLFLLMFSFKRDFFVVAEKR